MAVVGAGHLGRIHARIASSLPSVEVVAVVDPSAAAREAIARDTGATPLACHRELLGEVDAAVVASPTTTHFAVADDLMRGGIHVLVEKPLVSNSEQASELAAVARRKNVVLQVGHVERFNPALTAALDDLQSPKFIDARRLGGYTFRSTDIGVVMDLMIHDIDIILAIDGSEIVDVEALGVSLLGGHEDIANARLKFASGCVANLSASRVSYHAQRLMHVFTPTRFASIDFAEKCATVSDPCQDILQREFSAASVAPGQPTRTATPLFPDLISQTKIDVDDTNAIEQEQIDFLRAIDTDGQPRVCGNAGRRAIEVAEEILQSIEQHRWDGALGVRQGPHANPLSAATAQLPDVADWSSDDTVIIRRKAG